MAHLPAYNPCYVTHQPVYAYNNEQNDIKTLFVSGLPDDVKAREIHNLFRTGRGNQGVKSDPQTGSTLHIEPARSNSRRIQIPGRGPYVVIDNRKKFNEDAEDVSSDEDDIDSGDASKPENPDSDTNDSSEKKREERVVEPDHALAPESGQNEKTTDGAQPCSTLFIANLGPNCTEDELKLVVSQHPGFNTLKMRARGGMPVAFADFEGVEQATKALNELQGSTLPSSDRGGMHIEHARSKMRKP